jgi:YetA-like protein
MMKRIFQGAEVACRYASKSWQAGLLHARKCSEVGPLHHGHLGDLNQRLMAAKKTIFGILLLVALLTPALASAQLPATLTVQEALYPGSVAGVSRTNEPFCQGVPIADSDAVTSVSQLGLTGATAGQFRMLGVWPSGNYKWVEVCGILSSLSAGATASVTLTKTGSGAFGGSNLAAIASGTITVTTGTMTATIKAAGNFNVLDTAVVGGTTVLATSSSANRGLILTGPLASGTYPANVSCTTACSTIYSSANDAGSSCTIEQNGPVMASIRCVGNHMDGSGDPYMQYTARLYFYKNKSTVKTTVVLRNANYATNGPPSTDAGGGTFNTAFKGMQAYELRLAPNITGTLTYSIGNDTGTPTTGTLNQSGGTDNVNIYQGISTQMASTDSGIGDCATSGSPYTNCGTSYTTDSGYVIKANGTAVLTGTSAQHPAGWADISDSTGKGMSIGVYQFSAYWPKSLEFDAGGADVRIGINPGENSQAIYAPWPAWSPITDTWLEFHTSAPASVSNDFLSFQHFLVAWPAPAYTNTTGVLPYAIADPAVEDAFYVNLATTSNPAIPQTSFCWSGSTHCTPDRGTTVATFPLAVYRTYNWGQGGGANQEEFPWNDIFYRFYQRGDTGRYLNSMHRYRFWAEKAVAHADGTTSSDSTVNGFTWRSRPQFGQTNVELTNKGRPAATSTNSSKNFVTYADELHDHWYGIMDYYFVSGDETIREAILPRKDLYLNPNDCESNFSTVGGCGQSLGYTRSLGIDFMGAARFSNFLTAISDANASAVLNSAALNYTNYVKPDVCVNNLPSGCTMPALSCVGNGCSADPSGVSKVRGVHVAYSARIPGYCPANIPGPYYRGQSTFQHSIMQEGLEELRNAKGKSASTNWLATDYNTSLDLQYGLAQFSLLENYNDDGTASWQSPQGNGLNNGNRFETWIDGSAACPAAPNDTTGTVTTNAAGTVTWASGPQFVTGGAWSGANIVINGTFYVINSVTDATHLTLYTPAFFPTVANTTAVPYIFQGAGAAGGGAPGAANGYVTSDGATPTTLTWVSGVNPGATSGQFPLDGSWNGMPIALNTNCCATVSSVTDATHLVLTTSWLSFTNKGYAINPGLYQIGSNLYGNSTLAIPCQGCWFNFHSIFLATGSTGNWERQFINQIQQLGYHRSGWPSDFGSYGIQQLIVDLNSSTVGLQDLPFTSTDNGGGSYTLSFTPPNGATNLRIKWSPKKIQNDHFKLLGFDNVNTQTFAVDPAAYMTWFGANAVAEPAVTPGVAQNVTLATGTSSLTIPNFSVKAVVPVAATPTITWSQPLTFPTAADTDAYYNGYHQIHGDALTGKVWIYSTSTAGAGNSIYSSQLHYYDALANTGPAPLTDNLQTSNPPLLPSSSTLPFTHHPMNQVWIDEIRHRFYTLEGVAGSNSVPEMWYFPLTNPPSGSAWTNQTTAHIPQGANIASPAVTITANITSTSQTSVALSANGTVPGAAHQYANGNYFKVDSEIFRVVSGGGAIDDGIASGPVTVTVERGKMGTAAATHTSGTLTPGVSGIWVDAECVHDVDDDAFICFGEASGGDSQAFQVFCDTSINPTPGTLTTAQSSVGCTLPDDWTNITAKSICTDTNACVAAGGGSIPYGHYFPNLLYDTVRHQIIDFGGSYTFPPQNDLLPWTMTYNPHTFAWTNKNPVCSGANCTNSSAFIPGIGTSTPQPQFVSTNGEERAMHAFNPVDGRAYFHWTGPAASNGLGGCQATCSAGTPQDWVYDPDANTWTEFQSGVGPMAGEAMTYDFATNSLVTWSNHVVAGVVQDNSHADMWVGKFSNAAVQIPVVAPATIMFANKINKNISSE